MAFVACSGLNFTLACTVLELTGFVNGETFCDMVNTNRLQENIILEYVL